jgi:hypothetical protein
VLQAELPRQRAARGGGHGQPVIAVPPDHIELVLRIEEGIERGLDAELPRAPRAPARIAARRSGRRSPLGSGLLVSGMPPPIVAFSFQRPSWSGGEGGRPRRAA